MESIPFKIYSASAGSGKTFTLVKEYLKVCLKSKSPQKFITILAITFTNKAASEMKERILTSLKAFSNPEKAAQTELEMMNAISSEMGLGKEELQSRSQLIFENILHRYSRFSVGTIDKFTHRVLKTFAQDIDLPSNFDVEIEQGLLLKQAVDLLITRAGDDEKLTRLFVNFIQSKTDDDKSWLIENDFYAIAEELLKESGQKHCENLKTLSLDQLFDLKKGVEKYLVKIDEKLSAVGRAFAEDCERKGLELKWIIGGARSGLPKYFKYLETKDWEKYIPGTRNQEYLEREDWCSGSAPETVKSTIRALRDKFYPLIRSCFEGLDEKYPKYVSFKLIDRNLYSVGVLQEISKEMQRIKEQNNIIPIGEFNKKIADVLQNEEGNFIYERLGERYSNYFIDEFQDTSILQWNNLTPLIENAVADGLKPGSAMIVGDAKQAIYRWRGGDVDQFINLQQTADDPKKQQAYRMEHLSLQKNYRSKAELVRFNNELFSSIARQISTSKYSPLFEKLNAQEEKGEGGYVSLEYLEGGADHDEQQLARCLEYVQKLKSEGFRYGDLCILTRTKAKGALVVKMLSDENVPVISSESLLLEQSTEVRFILNFLHFINEPEHPLYRFKILEFLYSNPSTTKKSKLTSEQILDLCKENTGGFYGLLGNFIAGFDIVKWRTLSLLNLCHKISQSFNLEKTARAYVQFFLDEVWDYGNNYSQDLYGFLNHWGERAQKLSVAVPEQIDAVQVMTIHKSKGLEFPVVLFPFANWDATTERDAKSWVDVDEPELKGLSSALIPLSKKLNLSTKKLQSIYEKHLAKVVLDNLNMLYVALTRAKTRLHIFTSSKEKKKNLNLYFDHFLVEKGLWVEGKKEYVFGEKVAPKKAPQKENKYLKTTNPIKDLSEVLKVNRQAPKLWDVNSPEKGSDKGKKVHEVLSYIKDSEGLKSAIKRAVREGLITNVEKPEIKVLVEKMLNHPKMKAYFAPNLKVKNEEEILLGDAKVIRPDRLVFEGEKITIIDYKTGRALPEHKRQIEKYKNALEAMGYKDVACVLAYVNDEGVSVKQF